MQFCGFKEISSGQKLLGLLSSVVWFLGSSK